MLVTEEAENKLWLSLKCPNCNYNSNTFKKEIVTKSLKVAYYTITHSLCTCSIVPISSSLPNSKFCTGRTSLQGVVKRYNPGYRLGFPVIGIRTTSIQGGILFSLKTCFQLKKKRVQLRRNEVGFPGGAVVENLPANAGFTGSSPGLGRSHMPRSN